MRHDRLEVHEAVLEQPNDARPGGRRVRAAPDDVHVPEHDPVGGKLEHLSLPGDAEQDDAAAGTHEPGREVDRLDRAGRLDHEVEPAADSAVGRRDGVLLGDVDGRRPRRASRAKSSSSGRTP